MGEKAENRTVEHHHISQNSIALSLRHTSPIIVNTHTDDMTDFTHSEIQ